MGFLPPALRNKPEQQPELHFERQVFTRLDKSRGWNDAGPQPITIKDFFSYCDGLHIYGAEDRERLLDMIQAMDQVYIITVMDARKPAEGDKTSEAVVVKQKIEP